MTDDRTDYETVRIQQPLNIKLRSECPCLCSQVDEYGRALVIGRCGEQCERRPR